MKLLLNLGNGRSRPLDNVIRAEQFADFHRVFEPGESGAMECPDATIRPRYWLIHSSDLKKPIRAVGFKVIQEK